MIEWTERQLDGQLKEKEQVIVFFHTPLCGTCQLAKKMLTVVEAMIPNVEIGMCNLNFMPDKAELYAIESVPCLTIIENNQVKKKIYAFHSIEYLLEELKNVSI